MNTTTQILQFLGVEEHETETFKKLLEFREGISVVKLARAMNKTRPALYGQLDRLLEKGLIKKYTEEKSSLYAPLEEKVLLEMYDEKLSIVEKNKSAVKKLFSQKSEAKQIPRFSVHEGKNSFDAIFMDILRSNVKEIFWIWPIEIMLEVVSPEQFEYFHQERIKRGITLNVLWSEKTKVDLKKYPFLLSADKSLRAIKVLPKGVEPTIGYGIYGNKVAVISNKSESFGFVVESKGFAESLKSEFAYLWGKSKRYNV